MSRRERRMLRRRGTKQEISQPKVEVVQPISTTHKFESIYKQYYKKLMFIPFFILLLAVIFLFVSYAQTGEFVQKGVSLKGGITVTVQTDKFINIGEAQETLSNVLGEQVSARALTQTGKQAGIIVDAAEASEDQIVSELGKIIGKFDKYSVEEIGSSLGESFFREIIIALILAFLFMGIVVFAYFRTPIPSLGIIIAAASDMIITLAVINIMGLKLSTAGIAAFLMLIGYSVDTDILLTTRVIKRTDGAVFNRMIGAFKTGLTMSFTTMAAVVVGLLVTQSETLKQILLILLIGLIVDVFVTWLQNTGILMWYMEKRKNEN